jgi:hypothetical protein
LSLGLRAGEETPSSIDLIASKTLENKMAVDGANENEALLWWTAKTATVSTILLFMAGL